HAAAPEGLSEDARGTKDAARFGIELVETRGHRREHRLGERRRVALRDGSNELLQVERISARASDEALHELVARVTEHRAHELFGGLLPELAKRQDEDGVIFPELRKELVDLGTRGREDEERDVEIAQERI